MRILLSGEYPHIYEYFINLGYECILTEKSKFLPKQTAYHADLQVLMLENKTIFVSRDFNKTIYGYEIEKCQNNLGDKYPNDCLLNALVLNRKIFCNKNALDIKVLNFANENNYKIVNVKQGYTKCSSLKINENAVITADTTIEKTLIENKVDVLKISNGNILLPGYNYGFIGGSSGVIEDTVYFTGNLDLHEDSNRIKSFIIKHGLKAVSISNKPLIDIGGIIVI